MLKQVVCAHGEITLCEAPMPVAGEGCVRLKPLMTRHFAFRDCADAYRYIDESREAAMKALIDVGEE